MENISFEKEQFDEMTRVLKAELIEKCIKNLLESNSIKIDNVDYTKLSDFTYWLVDNI
ncbi:hypothetical protein [Flavobacterium johnsoniae]|uniref:Uncharacterized protein n=1 Tax=Flavobacterium johnsoniae TaxID=986 RepID=A0A1M5HDL9_FLAJO|nr:hypothetical protein [Flavobacterium johnsoniae]SHG14034.1 hypothetical protein SAMN05444388_101818 [Flavobacterium johnsoniae]